MAYKTIYEITEIIQLYDINENFIIECIRREWIIPVDSEKNLFDIEDLARILLIKDLKEDFGANDESIPIILHLIDQLHWSLVQIKHYLEKKEK